MNLKGNLKTFPVKNSTLKKPQNNQENTEKTPQYVEKIKEFKEITFEIDQFEKEKNNVKDEGFNLLGGLLGYFRKLGNQEALIACRKIDYIRLNHSVAKLFLKNEDDDEFFDNKMLENLKVYFDKKGLSFEIICSAEEEDYLQLSDLLGGNVQEVDAFN